MDYVNLGDGVFDKVSNESLIQTVWDTQKTAPEKNVHEISKLGAENIIRQAMLNRSMDNVTVIMISLAGIENGIQALQQNLYFDRKYEITSQQDTSMSKGGLPTSAGGIGKQLQLENYEINVGKYNTDHKSNMMALKPSLLLENSRLQSHREHVSKGRAQQTAVLPEIRSSSYHNIYGQTPKISQPTTTPRDGK